MGGPFLTAAVAAIALAGCRTYELRKSALAPHLAPPMRSGFGLGDAKAEAAFGASSLARAERPEQGSGADAGLFIPRLELGAAVRARLGDNFDIGLLWDHGSRDGAYDTSPDQPSPGGESVYGGGPSLFASVPTASPSFRIGVGLDLLVYSIPYAEYSTCIENCAGKRTTIVYRDRETVGVYSLSLIPSWRAGRLTVFAGGTLRNHPTVDAYGVESEFRDREDAVEKGPTNFIASAGAEIELGAGIRALGIIYQPLTDDPIRYGPTLGIALRIPLARAAD